MRRKVRSDRVLAKSSVFLTAPLLGARSQVIPGELSVAPNECAIVVSYVLQVSTMGYSGETEVVEQKPGKKRIKVKTLGANSNIPLLARDIVQSSKLIHTSKLGRVQELLRVLQDRGYGQEEEFFDVEPQREGERERRDLYERGMGMVDEDLGGGASGGAGVGGAAGEGVQASFEDLDDYLEALYDDSLAVKVKATAKIAALAQRTDQLEPFLMHEALLGALARVLREDGRRSVDLATNVLSVFFAFSHFSQLHQVISEHQVGDATMRLMEMEFKRTDLREKDEGRPFSDIVMDALENASIDAKAAKTMRSVKKQDKLLYLCSYLLLNLSEDVTVERKMKKRRIVDYMLRLLERLNVELLILAVTFLKKLSIFEENKERMLQLKLVEKLLKFVPVKNEVLTVQTLRLLHNLSFDAEMRKAMVKGGLIPRVVGLMRSAPDIQPIVMGLLYHLSFEDTWKSMFTYTDAIDTLYELVLQVEDLRGAPELVALAVNLTQNSKNAEAMVGGERFQALLNHAIEHRDDLCFKIVRNISQHDNKSLKLRFRGFLDSLVDILKDSDSAPELLVEVLGTLGNLAIPEFDYAELIAKFDVLPFLSTFLQPGAQYIHGVVEDDILLEVVIFIGTVCTASTAGAVADAGLPGLLFSLLGEKKEDDEMVLQIAFAFHRLLFHAPTRDGLLEHQQIVYYLVDLMFDKNTEVRRTADNCLDLIAATSEAWEEEVRCMKFEVYNHEWLEGVDSGRGSVPGVGMGREMNLDDDDLEVDHTFHEGPEGEGEDGDGHVWQGADELGDFETYDDADLQLEPSEVGLGADMARYQDWR